MTRTKKLCDKCNKEISISNFNKHYNSCKGFNKKIIIDNNWKTENGKYKCPVCQKEFSKMGIGSHVWKNHTEEGKQFNPGISYKTGERTVWNKGLTKNTDDRIKLGVDKWKKNLNAGKFYTSQFNKPLSEDHKKNISNSMKMAHKEGRAWNIGKSRWNNESSYPELFFMKIIQNEFEDKNYKREYPVGIYSLDFAWVEKKKVIEIDGEQHQRFNEYKERDIRKDKYLNEQGWKVLRIKWKDMYHDTKKEIEKCKNFINE